MRYWLSSLAIVMFVVAVGDSQEKKKDKEPAKVEPKEPTEVMGKSFDQWRKEIHSSDPAKRETAMKNVLLFGPKKSYEAVQDYIDELNKHKKGSGVDLSVRVNGIMALSTIFKHKEKPDPKHVKEALAIYKMFLKDPQVIMRLRAVQGLPYLGMQSRELLGDVILMAEDPITWEARKEAMQIMIIMARGEKGVPDPKVLLKVLPVLKKAAADEKEAYLVRIVAVQGLGYLGSDSNLIDFRNALKDSSKDVRLVAVSAMAHAAKEKSLFDLRQLLEHKDKEMRLQALNAIAGLKEKIDIKKKFDPTLVALRARTSTDKEKEPIVIIWAHATIMTVTEIIDKTHMMPVVQRLGEKEVPTRLAALQVINMGGSKSKPFALKTVLELVDDPDLNVAIPAIETLVHMHAYEATPKLEAIMKDKKANEFLQEAAETALDNFQLLKAKEKSKTDTKTPEKK